MHIALLLEVLSCLSITSSTMRSNGKTCPSTVELKVSGNGVNKYPAKSHVRHVAELAGSPSSVLVIEGERNVNWANSDQPRTFRQDRYFYYITGCNEPGCWVTYDISKDFLTLWLPKPNASRVFYDGRGSTPEEAKAKYDVDDAKYIVLGFDPYVSVASSNPARTFDAIVKGENPPSKTNWLHFSDALKHAMDTCRAVKEDHEISHIREANRISSEAHLQVLEQLSRLDHETKAEGLFVGTCISAGAKNQAYGPIVGSGPNAGILHYQANDEAFGDRQVLLIDASCEWQLYAADITRTMPLNRKNPGHWPSKEAKAIYNIVENVQEACIRALKPGRRFIDINWHAVHMTIGALLKLGLLKGNPMEIFHAGTVGAFFPHGLGHHIGLEVHDITPTASETTNHERGLLAMTAAMRASQNPVGEPESATAEAYEAYASTASPCYQPIPGFSKPEHFSLNKSTSFAPCTVEAPPLEPGNVVTIEPGIYFNKYILDNIYLNDPKHRKHIDTEVLKRYMPVGGVRIEDDVLITEKGYENLTPAVKGEEMLAVIRDGAGDVSL